MYAKVTNNSIQDVTTKQVDGNCIINKRDKVRLDQRIDTVNDLYITGILSKKHIGMEYSRPDNFIKQKSLIKDKLQSDTDQLKHYSNRNLNSNINVLRQLDYIAPYLHDKDCLKSKRTAFDIYTNNKINRSQEFQEEFFKKAHLHSEMVKVGV
jgi:hypothetical protein